MEEIIRLDNILERQFKVMINEKRFHVTKAKKILHKVGRSWVVVSTAILGLIAGGTLIADNVHANVNHNVDHGVQNNDSLAMQKSNSANVNLVQSNGSQLNNNVNYSASTSTSINSNSTSSINTWNNVAQNIHREILKRFINKVYDPRVDENSADQTLSNNGLISIINNNVKNGRDSANAKDAYFNLMTFMKPESPLLSNAKLSGTKWINGLRQFQSDLSTINNNGQLQPALSKVIDNLSNITSKANNVSSGMFGGLLGDLHYSLGDLAVRFDTPGGFAHSILQEFIPNEDTLDRTGAVMRTFSGIDGNSKIKTNYTNVINDLQKLPNQDRDQQSLTLSDLSKQILNLAMLINRNGDNYLPSQDQRYFNGIVDSLNKASTDVYNESIIMKPTTNKSLKPKSNASAKSSSASSYDQSNVSSASASSLSSSASQSSSAVLSSSVTSINSNASNHSVIPSHSSTSIDSRSNAKVPSAEASNEIPDTNSQASISSSSSGADGYSNETSVVSSRSSVPATSQSVNEIIGSSSSVSSSASSTIHSSASTKPISVLSSIVSNIVVPSSSVHQHYSYSDSSSNLFNPSVSSTSSSVMKSSGSVSLRTFNGAQMDYQAPDLNRANYSQITGNTGALPLHKDKASIKLTQIPVNYKWFTVSQTCLAHNHIDSVGKIHDYRYVLRPGDLVQLKKIFKVGYDNHDVYRYEVKIHGHNYFVTGNSKFTREAYYQIKDLKHHRSNKAIVIKPCFTYRGSSRINRLRRGKTVQIKRVIRIGHNGVTRFELTDGMFITSNRLYMKLI